MQRFKNVLLVIGAQNGTQVALDRAVTLARKNKARLTVVRMVDQWPREARKFAELMAVSDVHEFVVEKGREQLEKLIAPIRPSGLHIDAKVLSGTPFLDIIREVLREKHDLVIMTSDNEERLKTRIFCSTSLHLMRKCPCPVWVMKPRQVRRFARVMAAVDTNPHDSNLEHDVLNTKIMDLASSLAEREQSELHVVHAWTMYGESIFRSALAHMDEEEVDAWVLEEREKHKRKLDKLIEETELKNVKPHVHLIKGDANTVLPELARERQIDLLVLGTVCRTGVAGFLIGNTAESALQHVNCSVLTVKPDGFVSPVKLDGT